MGNLIGICFAFFNITPPHLFTPTVALYMPCNYLFRLSLSSLRMRFSFPTVTLASISGAAVILTTSTPQSVTAILRFYEDTHEKSLSDQHERRATFSVGDECVKFRSPGQQDFADVGILGCGLGMQCQSDLTSSTGARCVMLQSGGKTNRRLNIDYGDGSGFYEYYYSPGINCTFANGTSGIKLKGNILDLSSGIYCVWSTLNICLLHTDRLE